MHTKAPRRLSQAITPLSLCVFLSFLVSCFLSFSLLHFFVLKHDVSVSMFQSPRSIYCCPLYLPNSSLFVLNKPQTHTHAITDTCTHTHTHLWSLSFVWESCGSCLHASRSLTPGVCQPSFSHSLPLPSPWPLSLSSDSVRRNVTWAESIALEAHTLSPAQMSTLYFMPLGFSVCRSFTWMPLLIYDSLTLLYPFL